MATSRSHIAASAEDETAAAGVHAAAVGRGDCELVRRAAGLALRPAGLVAPHPWAGCVLAATDDDGAYVLAEAWQTGQGGRTCEELAVEAAEKAPEPRVGKKNIAAFLNLEPSHGTYAGTTAAVDALLGYGVKRVIIGIASPLPGLRGRAVEALRAQGVAVHVLEDEGDDAGDEVSAISFARKRAVSACRAANTALLHRAALGIPFSIIKYAMTLDGKIATDSGDAVWISGPESRARVFLERSQSDCVVVGGNTVRMDNPRLTTRKVDGHHPTRVVLSRSLALPLEASLWNVSAGPTLVFTQTNTSQEMKELLRTKGVEVVEFDSLTPRAAMEYLYTRGFLRCFWECGGTLTAPAVADGVIHKVMAFVAPKVIGTSGNISPMGDLGHTRMSQALSLIEMEHSTIADDLLVQGYLPVSGGLAEVARRAAANAVARAPSSASSSTELAHHMPEARPPAAPGARELRFYKAWDTFGALSNFARTPIQLPMLGDSEVLEWASVEHFYQAHKFNTSIAEGRAAAHEVRMQEHPEMAAMLGRTAQRSGSSILRTDWAAMKHGVMRTALRAKFETHKAARELLLSAGDRIVIEDSPHDTVWGAGWNHSGGNLLGQMLMEICAELRNETSDVKRIRPAFEERAGDDPCGEHDCIVSSPPLVMPTPTGSPSASKSLR